MSSCTNGIAGEAGSDVAGSDTRGTFDAQTADGRTVRALHPTLVVVATLVERAMTRPAADLVDCRDGSFMAIGIAAETLGLVLLTALARAIGATR